MNTVKLDNPILINNASVSELTYDYNEITNDLFLEACMRSSRIGGTVNSSLARENNEALHLCFGKAAILAVNGGYAWEDLDRIKGLDLLRVSNVGRFFITCKSEASNQNNSGDTSENTANTSTPESESSEE